MNPSPTGACGLSWLYPQWIMPPHRDAQPDSTEDGCHSEKYWELRTKWPQLGATGSNLCVSHSALSALS